MTAHTLAARALHQARTGNWAAAADTITELGEHHGVDGIHVLLLGLADTVNTHQGLPAPDALTCPLWVTTTGVVTDTDDVPPPVRWAGRFIAARGNHDEPTCSALITSCTTDDEFLENLWTLLAVAATTLNALKGHP